VVNERRKQITESGTNSFLRELTRLVGTLDNELAAAAIAEGADLIGAIS
jgi:hypothetical protein